MLQTFIDAIRILEWLQALRQKNGNKLEEAVARRVDKKSPENTLNLSTLSGIVFEIILMYSYDYVEFHPNQLFRNKFYESMIENFHMMKQTINSLCNNYYRIYNGLFSIYYRFPTL